MILFVTTASEEESTLSKELTLISLPYPSYFQLTFFEQEMWNTDFYICCINDTTLLCPGYDRGDYLSLFSRTLNEMFNTLPHFSYLRKYYQQCVKYSSYGACKHHLIPLQ